MFESKGNQRKLLILRYFSKKGSATSLDVSSDLNMSLTNASERLRRYDKQDLLTVIGLKKGKLGRPTKVYQITETGQRSPAFLEDNVKFRRTETDTSKKYRSFQRVMDIKARILRKWGIPR